MDTRTADPVADKIAIIKNHMHQTYQRIQAKAQVHGNLAFTHVRKGLLGEPNYFWAMEAGYVLGTPFNLANVQQDAAWAMVACGCLHVCILLPQELVYGSH